LYTQWCVSVRNGSPRRL